MIESFSKKKKKKKKKKKMGVGSVMALLKR